MKDAKGDVFYIGKAKNLRNRIRSYESGSDTRAFVFLLDKILDDIEVILTHSDKEAIILENDLIKKYRPRYNIKLVDDKNFLCLRLDTTHDFPRLEVRRQFGKDKALYFGPYHSATALRQTLRIVNRHFQLRTCSDQVLNNRSRPCLQYQIKRCPAPCVFKLPPGEYQRNVKNVTSFLGGRADTLIANLTQRMGTHSDALEYEQAARLRDQIQAIRQSLERQAVASPDFVDRDVIGLYREGPAVEIHIMRTRAGRLIGAKRYSFSELETPTADILSEFVFRYYSAAQTPPTEILLPTEILFGTSLGALLSEKENRVIRVVAPQRGAKKKLVALADKNAKQAFIDKRREEGEAKTTLERLQQRLRLRAAPIHIECYDISHFQSSHIVASSVAFINGVPDKTLYRHYKIQSTTIQDDFKSMYEVISRRTRRGLEEGNLPNLMVIDGGKGQLGSARAALEDHGVDWVELISLAKSRILKNAQNSEIQRSNERVFVHGVKDPIVLKANSSELFLLMRARDEAHRFAIEFQRKKLRKANTRSQLEDIPGIGPKRRRQLLSKFGSIKRLQSIPFEELRSVVGPKVAQAIIEYFETAPNHKKGL